MTLESLTERQRWLSLTAPMLGVLGVGVAFGALVPLVTLLLEERGVDTALIGLNTAMFSIAVFVVAPVLPRLVGRLGTLPSIYLGLAMTGAAVLLFPVLRSIAAWLALRFVIGIGSAIHWLVTEVWMNTVATDRNRSLVMGIYAMTIAGGFAVGPAIVSLTGTASWLPFLLTFVAVALSAVPIVLARDLAPEMPANHPSNLVQIMRMAPLVVAAGLVGGFCDTALYALVPVYLIRSGIAPETALLMLSFFTAGNLVLQVPLGWLADRTSRFGVLLLCAAATLAGAVLLPLLIGQPALLWPMLLLWGGTSFGVYTVGLGLLGERFAGSELANANAAMIMAYTAGMIAGPVGAGAAMDVTLNGLPAVVGAASAVFLLWALLRRERA